MILGESRMIVNAKQFSVRSISEVRRAKFDFSCVSREDCLLVLAECHILHQSLVHVIAWRARDLEIGTRIARVASRHVFRAQLSASNYRAGHVHIRLRFSIKTLQHVIEITDHDAIECNHAMRRLNEFEELAQVDK